MRFGDKAVKVQRNTASQALSYAESKLLKRTYCRSKKAVESLRNYSTAARSFTRSVTDMVAMRT